MEFREIIDDDYSYILKGEFSEPVTITTGNESKTINALYEESYQIIDPDSQAVVMSNKPRVHVFLPDIGFDVEQDETKVDARGKTWTVRESMPDGEGGAFLLLD